MFWLLGQRGVDAHNHCNGEQFVMFHECTASLRATLHWCIQSRFLRGVSQLPIDYVTPGPSLLAAPVYQYGSSKGGGLEAGPAPSTD